MNCHTKEGDWESGVGVRRVSSGFFDLVVTSPYVAIKFPSGTIRRNQTAELKCKVEHLQSFTGIARVSLLGLPKGVTTVGEDCHIASDTEEITFTLKATEEALLGQYKELKCEVTYNIDGQSIRQVSQNGTLRVDPATSKGGE